MQEFRLGLYQAPTLRLDLRQTLIRVCPHCGVENEVGMIAENDLVLAICWSCLEPIYYKNATFEPFQGQGRTKPAKPAKSSKPIIAKKPANYRAPRGKSINVRCPNCGIQNSCGENESKMVVNGIVTVCWACLSPLLNNGRSSIKGMDYFKVRLRKAKQVVESK